MLLLVALLHGASARAEEVPASPIAPPPYPGSLIPEDLVGTGAPDDVVVTGLERCDEYFQYLNQGRAVDCSSTGARPKTRCVELHIDPGVTGTHDHISWRPRLDGTGCYISRGQMVDVEYSFRASSSRVGEFRNRSSGYTLDSDHLIKQMTAVWGEYDCDRTLGTTDTVTFIWSAEGGGTKTDGSLVVPCN